MTTAYAAALHYRNEAQTQVKVSSALENCCRKLTASVATNKSKEENRPLYKTIEKLSILLNNLSDENQDTPIISTPWYETKVANWSFITAGIICLVAYLVVSSYDQVWQNNNNPNTPARPIPLLVLMIFATTTLTAHTGLSIIKTKLNEERQEALEKTARQEQAVTRELIAAATALRDYLYEKEQDLKVLHLDRFSRNFKKLPKKLFTKCPEVGEVIGALIKQLPKKDPLRVLLRQMVRAPENGKPTHYLRTENMDTGTKLMVHSDKEADSFSALWKKLDELVDLEGVKSIKWGSKSINCPQYNEVALDIGTA